MDISQAVGSKAPGSQLQGNNKDIFSSKDASGGKINGGGVESEEAKKLKRDVTPMPDYYKNWDRFNIVSILSFARIC